MNTTLSSSMSTLNSIFPALTATANGKHDETLIFVQQQSTYPVTA